MYRHYRRTNQSIYSGGIVGSSQTLLPLAESIGGTRRCFRFGRARAGPDWRIV